MNNQTETLQGKVILDIHSVDEQKANHVKQSVEQFMEQLATEGVSHTFHDGVSINARYVHDNAPDDTVHSDIKQLQQNFRSAFSDLNLKRVMPVLALASSLPIVMKMRSKKS